MPEAAARTTSLPPANESNTPSMPEPARYNPHEIEPRWQARWDADPALYRAEDPTSPTSAGGQPKPKFYCLEMLPYPSGQLHIGHVRNYAIGDALARYMWMRGYNVLHPMGWDAFGLPAENAALKNNTPPRDWTLNNIAQMRTQLKRLGFSYDWQGTEIATCLPEYYRWNQWFFLKFYEKGLAYRQTRLLNWCPRCATVLANEQVVAGCCWRHEDTPVEQREMVQWFLRITHYGDSLLDGLDQMPGWPEKVRTMQRNWIGRSEGTQITFPVTTFPVTTFPVQPVPPTLSSRPEAAGRSGETPVFADARAEGTSQQITVFTTRVDTIFGATSLQLAPEHPLVKHWSSADDKLAPQVEAMVAQQQAAKASGDLGNIEKHGVFTGQHAINPFTGAAIPIWVANYILADYGTGAIMSVPAHDERDYEFATKYGLPIKRVVAPSLSGGSGDDTGDLALPYTGEEEAVLIDSGEWTGEPCLQAQEKMGHHAEANGFGKRTTTYRLKDWGVSRQRYWGTPIPFVYCTNGHAAGEGREASAPGGPVPLPESALPVLLPDNITITQEGGSPLARLPEFVNTTCPVCNGPARRETDTMDTFVDSSWYFYRYTDAHNAQQPFDPAKAAYWFPIDQYIGGVEHAILHLIYARFWTRAMRDLQLTDTSDSVISTGGAQLRSGETRSSPHPHAGKPLITNDEPVARLFTQGMVIKDGAKMSKSKGNIVAPDDMIARFGVDATRVYALFATSPDRELDWQEDGVAGVSRFLARFYRLATKYAPQVRSIPVPAIHPVPGNTLSSRPEAQSAAAERPLPSASASSDLSPLTTAGPSSTDTPLLSSRSEAEGSAFPPAPTPLTTALLRTLHQTIGKITEDFNGRWHFNTSISAVMILVNELASAEPSIDAGEVSPAAIAELLRSITLLLAPFAPFLAAELWEQLGGTGDIVRQPFPSANPELVKENEVEIPVQVNGKLVAVIRVPADADETTLKTTALAQEKVATRLQGKTLVKTILVKGKLLNLVIK